MRSTTDLELDAQYRALREEAGALLRARGVLAVSGTEAAEFLQGQLTNDVEALPPGEGCYAALLDRKGHMQADMRVLRIAADELLLDTEPETAGVVLRHLSMYRVGREAEVADQTSERAIVSLIGAAAAAVAGIPAAREHAHREAALNGTPFRAIATDLGFDLLCGRADAQSLLEALAAAGAESVEEEAAEILRVESGRPRFGREMTSSTIPQEAGINERAVSFTKGCYIGQETVARLHYRGKPNRHLRGLLPDQPVSAGEEVHHGEREVGRVGTAVVSPARGPIALAVLRREAAPGETVAVGAEAVRAEVIQLPFE